MSSTDLQIVKKLKVKKPKPLIEFIILEDFDITRLKELPEFIVAYCFSFLSTKPNYPPVANFANIGPNFRKLMIEKHPCLWWRELVRSETKRKWELEYVPALTERFQKMSNARLKQLTADTSPLTFQPEGNRSQSKKEWLSQKLSVAPTNEYARYHCLWMIFFSKGMTPTDKNLLHPLDK